MCVDINGDNLPELISVRGYEDDFILPIDSIYTYIGAVMKPLDRVYWDPSDLSEFLYFGSTGNLIYEHCDSGQLTQGRYYYKIGAKTSEERNDGDETQPEREEITLEEFLNEYKQITGFDFFEAYPYYEFT